MNPIALVADVGDTQIHAALAFLDGARPRLKPLRNTLTPSGRLAQTLTEQLQSAGIDRVDACAVAAAGRVVRLPQRSVVRMSGIQLTIDREDFAAATGASKTYLLNDLAAVAASVSLLKPEELIPVGIERPIRDGVRLVVGIDPGFGAAVLTADDTILETQAGQLDLAAVSAEERQFLNRLSPLGRLSVEGLLSETGLSRLYEAVGGPPGEPTSAIIRNARSGEPCGRKAMVLFSTWLGRVVGNLVLAYGSWGGVYLVGSVLDDLDESAFRKGMDDKAPFTADIRAVPVNRIRHPRPSLLGLASLAMRDQAN